MSPSELLEERISDIVLSRGPDKRLLALLDAAKIAIPAVLNAAKAGNVQCQVAAKQILPFLCQLKT